MEGVAIGWAEKWEAPPRGGCGKGESFAILAFQHNKSYSIYNDEVYI